MPFRKSYSHTIFELFFSDLYSDELEEDIIGNSGTCEYFYHILEKEEDLIKLKVKYMYLI